MTDNELIAEFMGATDYKHDSGIPHYYFPVKPHSRTNTIRRKSSLEYDSSWDWLMPVVEKIGDIWDLNEFGTASEKVLKLPISSHIQQVYNAVVEFIKWYNENK